MTLRNDKREQGNSVLKGKRVLIFQQRKWAFNIGHFLALKLQREGCRLAALTLKRSTHKFIVEQKDVEYDLIISNDEIMGNPKAYLNEDTYSLEEICRALGVSSVWPIVMTLRNHVRSYKDKFYYGFKQNVPDDEIVDYVMATFKYIRHIFKEFKPDLIIAPNMVALPHIMMNKYAMQQGVDMISVTNSTVKGVYIFAQNHIENKGAFQKRVDVLNETGIDSPNREKARNYIYEFRKKFIKPKDDGIAQVQSPWKKIKQELLPYRLILDWYWNKNINVLESTGITIDNRPPRIILRDHFCKKKYKKYMENFSYYPFDKLKKYIYFPLQFQPEANIDVVAPYFSNQLETARLLAMSLPDGYTLAVKEHPAMFGYRPPSYLEKIGRTPNVKFIDFRITTDRVLKGADLVISPNSTTLAEASFYNKPAIQLGNWGVTLKLPNVYQHTDMTTISEKMKELLALDLKTAEYETGLENFVVAAYDTGFDFDYQACWERGVRENIEELWQVYRKELARLFRQKDKG